MRSNDLVSNFLDLPGMSLMNPTGLGISSQNTAPIHYSPADADSDNAEEQTEWFKSPLLVHDYAKGGDTVDGVRYQIQQLFLPGVGKKPGTAPWTASDTLFVTWVGINDCSRYNPENDEPHKMLFEDEAALYDAGARNFLFIDVPSVHRSPAVPYYNEELVKEKVEAWNTMLRKKIEEFASARKDANVFLFSSFETFNNLLDNLGGLGFKAEDARRQGGTVWIDHIHPTSKVHEYIAKSLSTFLGEILPQ